VVDASWLAAEGFAQQPSPRRAQDPFPILAEA